MANTNAIYGAMIELQFINYIYQKNSFQSVILHAISDEYFTTYKEHFNFIKQFYEMYKQLPSKETFQAKFTDCFEWINVTDPEEYLISKLKEAKLYRDLLVDYKTFTELIKDGKSDVAVEKMAEISRKYMKDKDVSCVDLISDAKIRYNSYIERKDDPFKAMAPTGLKEVDAVTGGWDMLNETAVIVARTGIGKSWWTIFFALQAAKMGLRVGFYSGEMESDLVGYRLDTFLSGISNGALTHGNDIVYDSYTDYINNINSLVSGHVFVATPYEFGGSPNVSKIRAFIEKYDIQFMCIDQISLMEDERKARSPVEQLANISKDLRALQRIKKIPFLIAAQLNRDDTTEGITTKNIGGSDRIGQDATTVLSIERTGDQLVFTVVKARNSKTGEKWEYYWDPNTGKMYYIPSDTDAVKGKGDAEIEYSDTAKSDTVF